MYFIVIEAIPVKHGAAVPNVGRGALAFWIRSDSADDALARARSLLSEMSWQEKKLTEVRPISRDGYSADDPNIEYFDQAVIDGEVCVVYTYPLDDAE